jgi:cellulose synthase/poly-beta-1,6-N-acetylglucosamine synthase-like glycosyltransferase
VFDRHLDDYPSEASRIAAESMPVSVVTTARNAEEFIPDFCRSWKSQTHANFEMIFVDDGSEDNTGSGRAR